MQGKTFGVELTALLLGSVSHKHVLEHFAIPGTSWCSLCFSQSSLRSWTVGLVRVGFGVPEFLALYDGIDMDDGCWVRTGDWYAGTIVYAHSIPWEVTTVVLDLQSGSCVHLASP